MANERMSLVLDYLCDAQDGLISRDECDEMIDSLVEVEVEVGE